VESGASETGVHVGGGAAGREIPPEPAEPDQLDLF